MSTTVWSEQNEPNAPGWRDCVYSAGLMALDFGGFTGWPAGWHTVAEREALERSDSRADETGASVDDLVVAVKRRYGITLRKLDVPIDVALTRVGTALALEGNNATLPTWLQHRFTGSHAVCVIPLGNGRVQWLDPMDPMGFGGNTIDAAIVARWAWGQSRACVVAKGEFAPVVPAATPPAAPAVTLAYGGRADVRGTWRVKVSAANVRTKPFLSGTVAQVLNSGATFTNAQTTDSGELVAGSRRWYGDRTGKRWIHSSLVTLVK